MSSLSKLFPEAQKSSYKSSENELLSLQDTDGSWLNISRDSLTEREAALWDSLSQAPVKSKTPWESYLTANHRKAPTPFKRLQCLHVFVGTAATTDLDDEWFSIWSDLFPNLIGSFQPTPCHYVFVLNQDTVFDTKEHLIEVLPNLEFDFGRNIKVLMGQIWDKELLETDSELYTFENQLFLSLLERGTLPQLIQLSQALLVYPQKELLKALATSIRRVEDLEETVTAIWQAQAVLTKAAQNLYIHRNTLQYRLEKCQEQLGLSLKNMDDLAVAYLALLQSP